MTEEIKLPMSRRDVLLEVLGKLNSNPYSLTKSECIDIVREMFDHFPDDKADHFQQKPSLPFLSDQDMADLTRLNETMEDGEGYDVPAKKMKRLAELGAVRWRGGDRFSITSFGAFVLKSGPTGFITLPLQTADQFNTAQDEALRQRLDAARAEKEQ